MLGLPSYSSMVCLAQGMDQSQCMPTKHGQFIHASIALTYCILVPLCPMISGAFWASKNGSVFASLSEMLQGVTQGSYEPGLVFCGSLKMVSLYSHQNVSLDAPKQW